MKNKKKGRRKGNLRVSERKERRSKSLRKKGRRKRKKKKLFESVKNVGEEEEEFV